MRTSSTGSCDPAVVPAAAVVVEVDRLGAVVAGGAVVEGVAVWSVVAGAVVGAEVVADVGVAVVEVVEAEVPLPPEVPLAPAREVVVVEDLPELAEGDEEAAVPLAAPPHAARVPADARRMAATEACRENVLSMDPFPAGPSPPPP